MTCEKYVKHIRDLIHIKKTFRCPLCIKAPLENPCIDPISAYQLKKSLKMFFVKSGSEKKVDLLFFINMKLMLAESSKNYLIYVQIESLAFFPITLKPVNVYSNRFPMEFNHENDREILSGFQGGNLFEIFSQICDGSKF